MCFNAKKLSKMSNKLVTTFERIKARAEQK